MAWRLTSQVNRLEFAARRSRKSGRFGLDLNQDFGCGVAC